MRRRRERALEIEKEPAGEGEGRVAPGVRAQDCMGSVLALPQFPHLYRRVTKMPTSWVDGRIKSVSANRGCTESFSYGTWQRADCSREDVIITLHLPVQSAAERAEGGGRPSVSHACRVFGMCQKLVVVVVEGGDGSGHPGCLWCVGVSSRRDPVTPGTVG